MSEQIRISPIAFQGPLDVYLCACLLSYVCAYMVGARGGQKRALDLMKLELHPVMDFAVLVRQVFLTSMPALKPKRERLDD